MNNFWAALSYPATMSFLQAHGSQQGGYKSFGNLHPAIPI
jgi:hypothetical protein